MNLAAFMGSPRKNNNTDVLLNEFLRGVAENSNTEIKYVFLQQHKISNCIACNSCKNTNKCVIKDDMQELYPIFENANTIVFATPIYWWSMSSQLKSFFDRLYCVGSKNMKGKKAYLLMTYGGDLPNSGPELVEKTFADIFDYVGIELKGVLGACSGKIKVAENEEVLKRAYELGKSAALKSELIKEIEGIRG